MTDQDCQRYFEDPEANASHLATCAECRAVESELHAPIESRPVTVDSLPMAAWEGARHRSWPLALGGGLAVLAISLGLFMMAGVSPTAAMLSRVPSIGVVSTFMRLLGGAVQQAPAGIQAGLLVLFLAVNTIFVLLLRRAPKGIDV